MKPARLEKYIIEKIRDDMPEHLYYHSVYHTIDVFEAVMRIGKKEQVDEEEMELLKAAALLHDIGFTEIHEGHEEVSCKIARNVLPYFEYEPEQVEHICSIIMATQLPQNPEGRLQEIICDADLDYLGTPEFTEVGKRLYKELKHLGKVQDLKQWNLMQINFLEGHAYFTKTAQNDREPVKRKHLESLKRKAGL